jgi:hypothetical protein
MARAHVDYERLDSEENIILISPSEPEDHPVLFSEISR